MYLRPKPTMQETKTYHASRLTVNGRRSLKMDAIDLKGNVFDTVTFEK